MVVLTLPCSSSARGGGCRSRFLQHRDVVEGQNGVSTQVAFPSQMKNESVYRACAAQFAISMRTGHATAPLGPIHESLSMSAGGKFWS